MKDKNEKNLVAIPAEEQPFVFKADVVTPRSFAGVKLEANGTKATADTVVKSSEGPTMTGVKIEGHDPSSIKGILGTMMGNLKED